MRRCAYCGKVGKTTREHVVPRCFYPESKATSTVQRITVRACRPCNEGWSDDEAHAKHVLLLAGESNAAVQELWPSALRAMTVAADARRRLFDVVAQLRGLCAHHGVGTAIPDARVSANVADPLPPPELLNGVKLHHVEEDIIEYWYDDSDEQPTIQSVWFLRFFERCDFVALVLAS